MRIGSRLRAVCAAAALAVSLSVGSATADPMVSPQAQDLVGVGAQTSQGLLNQLAIDYNASLGTGSTAPHLYSWDATGTSPITTKTGATTILRPDGAGAGVRALAGNAGATVDFARSDRAPLPTDPHGLDFVPLARDAVTWSAQVNGNAPTQLTVDQLAAIYRCEITNWSWIDPSLPDATIKPFLPQVNSGTRAFFLAAIGVTAPGQCVTTGPEENQGTDSGLGDPDVVFPYSVGHYLGQTVGGHSTQGDAPGSLSLRSIVYGTVTLAPVSNNRINVDLANSAFGRVIYDVVRDGEWSANDAHGQALQAIFGPDGWICNDPVAAADIQSYGYLTTPACGVETLT
ncbi:PstS family phosphate ABC transporter substrate-binding protein [Kitasatospora sp. NPDC048296]|uniref:PstS family phosphate ABC transporter substrate-binding protein n=1 Tax=Kitasatospora sp. NPDC048296 TaxID=3364048 RepID=UPI003710141E